MNEFLLCNHSIYIQALVLPTHGVFNNQKHQQILWIFNSVFAFSVLLTKGFSFFTFIFSAQQKVEKMEQGVKWRQRVTIGSKGW